MSNHQEERGTYTIPAKELPGLHKALREYANDLHNKVRAEVQRLHALAGGTRSVTKYTEAMQGRGCFDQWYAMGRVNGIPVDADPVAKLSYEVIDHMLRDAHQGHKSIHKPTVAEIERYAPKATNRTDEFFVDDEARISFHGREVTWSVAESNHSVDDAYKAPMARIFWDHMKRIRWTRNSGGYCLYADEHRRELGGGGDVETNRYGPLGQVADVGVHHLI